MLLTIRPTQAVYVELGNDAKYAMKREGTIKFQLNSRGTLEFGRQGGAVCTRAKEELALSLSDGGQRYKATFKNGQVLVCPKDTSPKPQQRSRLERETYTS